MIRLHLALIGKKIEEITLNNKQSLLDFLIGFKDFKDIWLVAQEDSTGEIFVTENFTTMIKSINALENLNTPFTGLYIQQYKSYEDAYKVALYMREPNEKCYDL